jgi:hypothetical protein
LKKIEENRLKKKYGGKMDKIKLDRMEFYEIMLNYKDDLEKRKKYG